MLICAATWDVKPFCAAKEAGHKTKTGFLFYDPSITGKSTDREQMSGCTVEEEEMAGDYFKECGVLFCDDEKLAKLERSGGCTTWWNALNATELHTL